MLLAAALEGDELPTLEEADSELVVDPESDVGEVERLESVVDSGGSDGKLVLVLLDEELVLVLKLGRFVLIHCTLSLLPLVSV